MKKYFIYLVLPVIALIFTACGSVPENGTSAQIQAPSENQIQNQTENRTEAQTESQSQVQQNKKNQKKNSREKFSDWKYKGFGVELPKWIENAVDGNIDVVKKSLKISEDIDIITASGKNVDQSEQKLKIVEKEHNLKPENEVFDFWVKENSNIEESYVSIKIFKK